MTRLSLLFFVGLFANAVLAETLAMALMRDGAIATIQLRVVDEQGRPIEDVEAHLGFWKPASALFASNRRCFTDGDYILRKDGYYPTQRHIRTPTPYHETIEEGFFSYRWRDPYVKTEVLRDIRNPCPMKAYSRAMLKSPPKGETWGLDLELMEWLPPNGNGKHLDVLVSLELELRQNGQLKWEEVMAVNLAFPNPMDGVQLCDKVEESDFYSTYQVDLTRPFETQLRLAGSEDRYHFLPYNQYLVFRVRSVISACRMTRIWSLTRSGIWPRMRRWSSTVGGGFICREAGWIQERRVDDETDDLYGDGDVGGGNGDGCHTIGAAVVGLGVGKRGGEDVDLSDA